MSKLRLGMIGCGGVAQNHFSGLAGFDDVELAAFCDLDPGRLAETVAKYGGKGYASHDEMLDAEGLAAVSVTLPPFAHGPAELAAIERKLPFFVEKPVGNDLGVLKEIAAEVERAGL